jgi:hypothetical protein
MQHEPNLANSLCTRCLFRSRSRPLSQVITSHGCAPIFNGAGWLTKALSFWLGFNIRQLEAGHEANS